MTEWMLRGYVTPEDFGGDVQAALDAAEKLDIRKVILEKDYSCGKLTIPAYTHLIINGTLKADLQSRHLTGWNFEQDRFFLEGGGKVEGDVTFFNTRRAVLEGLRVKGTVTFLFSRDFRMENCHVDTLLVGRGCANAILQHLRLDRAAISQAVFDGDIVHAKDPQIQSIVLRDSRFLGQGLMLLANEAAGLTNIQADHLIAPQTAVTLGEAGTSLPPERYFNLTFTDLEAPQPLKLLNETKHAYLKP